MGGMRYSLVLSGLLAATAATAALAEWSVILSDDKKLEPLQLFEIYVEGDRAKLPWDPDKRLPPIKEFGTGFAVAPGIIITARHVTHNALEFVSHVDKIQVPKRTVTIRYPETEANDAEIRPFQELWITPAPVPVTDAARLTLVGKAVAPLPLSVCGITPNTGYQLLKFAQDGNGKAKDLHVPVLVPVNSDADETKRLGELRRFDHEITNPEKRPTQGDSGAPILNEKGKVVGLLSAVQGDNFLYVTPTSSFVDLIPPASRKNIDCYDAISREEIKALETRIDTLESTLATLTNAHEKLAAQVAANASMSQWAMSLLVDPEGRRALTEEQVSAAIEKFERIEPVIPAVKKITTGLSDLDWGYRLIPLSNAQNLNVQYRTLISTEFYAEELTLCYRPMVDFKSNVDPMNHKKLDFRNLRYYQWSDDELVTDEYMTKCPRTTPIRQGRKTVIYRFPIPNPAFPEDKYEMLDFEDWAGRYYAFTYGTTRNPETGAEEKKIHHRFFLKLSPTGNLKENECYFLRPTGEELQDWYNLTSFLTDLPEDEREAFECTDL